MAAGGGTPVTPVTPLRHLGRLRLLAVGVNSVIGGGIFIMPAVVAARVGSASLPAYLVAGLFVAGVGMALARLAATHDRSGGPYVYIHDAFGPFAGFQAGWLFTLARLTAAASLFNGFARYVAALLPGGGGVAARVFLVLVCATFVTGVNIAGIRQTAAVANTFAVLKVVPLLVLAVAGLFAADLGRLAPTACDPAEFVRAVLLLVFAFTGFEIATLPAEESHRPRSDMPAALALTLLIVCSVYLAVQAMAMGLVPDLGREQAPLATAAGLVGGQPGRYAITAVAALSTAGCSLASLVGGSRMMYAMSSGRQIPAWIGALTPRFRTPAAASLLLGGIGAVLAMLAAYEWLSAVSTGARLLVYLGCCLACLRPRAGAGVVAKGVALITAVAVVGLLGALEPTEAIAGMIGLTVGIVLFLAARRGRAVATEGDV